MYYVLLIGLFVNWNCDSNIYDFFTAAANFGYSIVTLIGSVKASIFLHSILLTRVLHWPSYLFDTTPVGRIVNRFGYDVDVIDNRIPMTFKTLVNHTATVCLNLIHRGGINRYNMQLEESCART